MALRTFQNSFLSDVLDDPPQAGSSRRNGNGRGGDGIPRHHRGSGTRGDPMGDGAPAGSDGGDDGGPMSRRERLLQRRRNLMIDTDELDRPEYDQGQERLQQIATGVGAATALLGALGGSEIAARAGEGLATGGAQQIRRQRKRFRRRRKGFRERLQQARQFNREVQLSTNEARVRGAEQQAEREFQEEQAEEEREFQREQSQNEREARKALVRLKDRLQSNDNLSDLERQKLRKEIDLIEAQIGSQEALAFERTAQGVAAGQDGGDGGGGGRQSEARERFGHLSDDQLNNMLTRTREAINRGVPPSADLDQNDKLSTEERQLAARSGNVYSTSDMDRLVERLNFLQAERQRRQSGSDGDGGTAGGNGGGQPRGGRGARSGSTRTPRSDSTGAAGRDTPSPGALNAEPDSAEIERAKELVQEGILTPEQFRQTYGQEYTPPQ